MLQAHRAGEAWECVTEHTTVSHRSQAWDETVCNRAHYCVPQVRKAQLLKLLQEEHRQHEAELHSMGLAFHRDRI